MKFSIRENLFETNSSSSHSLTILSEDEIEKWKSGNFLLDMPKSTWDHARLISKAEFEAKYKNFFDKAVPYVLEFGFNPDEREELRKDLYFNRTAIYTYDQVMGAIDDEDGFYRENGVTKVQMEKLSDGRTYLEMVYRIS